MVVVVRKGCGRSFLEEDMMLPIVFLLVFLGMALKDRRARE